MSANPLIKQLQEQDPQIAQVYEIYRKSTDVYRRSKIAIGNMPKYKVLISNTKTIKVENGTNWSSKILTFK